MGSATTRLWRSQASCRRRVGGPFSAAGRSRPVAGGLSARRAEADDRLPVWAVGKKPGLGGRGPVGRLATHDSGRTDSSRERRPAGGLTVLLGLVVFSIAALFIYYPEEAIRQIQHWDLLTRKLQVGVFIRTGRLHPEVSKQTEDLRERLEELRDALLADNLNEAKAILPKLEET